MSRHSIACLIVICHSFCFVTGAADGSLRRLQPSAETSMKPRGEPKHHAIAIEAALKKIQNAHLDQPRDQSIVIKIVEGEDEESHSGRATAREPAAERHHGPADSGGSILAHRAEIRKARLEQEQALEDDDGHEEDTLDEEDGEESTTESPQDDSPVTVLRRAAGHQGKSQRKWRHGHWQTRRGKNKVKRAIDTSLQDLDLDEEEQESETEVDVGDNNDDNDEATVADGEKEDGDANDGSEEATTSQFPEEEETMTKTSQEPKMGILAERALKRAARIEQRALELKANATNGTIAAMEDKESSKEGSTLERMVAKRVARRGEVAEDVTTKASSRRRQIGKAKTKKSKKMKTAKVYKRTSKKSISSRRRPTTKKSWKAARRRRRAQVATEAEEQPAPASGLSAMAARRAERLQRKAAENINATNNDAANQTDAGGLAGLAARRAQRHLRVRAENDVKREEFEKQRLENERKAAEAAGEGGGLTGMVARRAERLEQQGKVGAGEGKVAAEEDTKDIKTINIEGLEPPKDSENQEFAPMFGSAFLKKVQSFAKFFSK